jgi:Ca2+-binding EF-hand superfamily protein
MQDIHGHMTGADVKRADSRIDEIQESFTLADEDGDGQISLTEFRGLMLALDRLMGDDAVTTSFLAIDADNNGRVGFPEFRSWWLRD